MDSNWTIVLFPAAIHLEHLNWDWRPISLPEGDDNDRLAEVWKFDATNETGERGLSRFSRRKTSRVGWW